LQSCPARSHLSFDNRARVGENGGMRVEQLAKALRAEFSGAGEREVAGVASAATAGATDLIFVEEQSYLVAALESPAAAVLVARRHAEEAERLAGAMASAPARLVVASARLGFARAAAILRQEGRHDGFVHPSAVLDPGARLGECVEVGALCYIGPGVEIGARTRIGPGCVLLGETVIGEECELVARVTVYPQTRLGRRVIVQAGAVLGGDGFGFVPDPSTGTYEKFPQIGRLEIGDDVEIGANATVDRGALEATVIERGVKLDNMVHVGHNVRIGENVVIAAQTGVSGSSVVERNVLVGGQVGIADHVHVEEGAILGAQCGIPSKKTIRGKGIIFWGTPARPIAGYLKELAVLARLAKGKKKE
jgi:UDP-3-O-[3-hydroxymyristoyl] glucosamine N-acyltransferase